MSSRHIRGAEVRRNTTVHTGAGDVTVVNESMVIVKKASGAATGVILPASPVTGRRVTVKDGKGDAATNNITVTAPSAGTIDGAASYVIDANYGSVAFDYNGSEWGVVGGGLLGSGGSLNITGDITRASGTTDFSMRTRVRVVEEDFFLDAGSTLPKPWGKQDTSAAGSPTTDYVADALNGEYQLTHDTQSEAQTLTLYFADQLVIDPTKKPVFECRLKINFAGATFSADQRIVIGLASARNATLDSIATNVWFRIEGANLNILKEADDGTTDTDDVDTTIDVVDNTYTTFRIDLSNTSAIGFYVDGVAAGGAAVAAAALSAAMKLQPYIEIQRDAGAEAESVVVDYVLVEQDRT